MPTNPRDADDLFTPRRVARTEATQIDPPQRATAEPTLRERIAEVVDRYPGGGDGDPEPPDAGPAHPIEVDIERPDLALEIRERIVDDRADGDLDDGGTGGFDDPAPMKDSGDAHLDYLIITLENCAVGDGPDAGDVAGAIADDHEVEYDL